MTAEAIAGDRQIAMVLLRPGWEPHYDDEPEIYPVACLGELLDHERLPDGRYDLLLRGTQRIRILHEIEDDKRFRSAHYEAMPNLPAPETLGVPDLRKRMAEAILPHFANNPSARDQITSLFESELPLGSLCDIVSFSMPMPLDFKQRLLEEPRTLSRVISLIEYWHPQGRRPTPGFSAN